MNYTIARFLNALIEVFTFLILIDVIASWVVVLRVRLPDIVLQLLQAVHSITGVVLNPIRRVIPSLGGLDISPIVALLLLDVVRRVVIGALLR